ncbi:MAG: hypothetical protein ACUVQY_05100 [Thermoproteota archaeon]
MITTVIGSLPRLDDDLKTSIKFAIDLQTKIGIDIISDGEQRADMISYLSNSMLGVELVNGRLHVVSRIRPIEDVEKSFKIVDFLEARRYIREKGYSNRLKIGVTGPITFGFLVALNSIGPYGSVRNMELYRDVAYALNQVLKGIQQYDGLTQIDEPGISAGFMAPSLVEEPLAILTEGLDPNLTSMHVCGKLSLNVLRVLSRIRGVDVLSLEFSRSPTNMDLLSRDLLRKSAKIGIGCMRSNISSIGDLTSPEQALETIKKVISKIGEEHFAYIHPDCGLRETGLDLAVSILKNLVDVSRRFSRDIKRDDKA